MPRRGQEGVLTGLIPLSHKILAQTHSLQLNKNMSLCFLLHYTNNLSQLGQKKNMQTYIRVNKGHGGLFGASPFLLGYFFNVPVSRCTHFDALYRPVTATRGNTCWLLGSLVHHSWVRVLWGSR